MQSFLVCFCRAYPSARKAPSCYTTEARVRKLCSKRARDGVDIASRIASSAACCSSGVSLDAALNKLVATLAAIRISVPQERQ